MAHAAQHVADAVPAAWGSRARQQVSRILGLFPLQAMAAHACGLPGNNSDLLRGGLIRLVLRMASRCQTHRHRPMRFETTSSYRRSASSPSSLWGQALD